LLWEHKSFSQRAENDMFLVLQYSVVITVLKKAAVKSEYDNEKQLQNHLSRVILNVARGDENFTILLILFLLLMLLNFKCFRFLLFQNIRISYINISKLYKAPWLHHSLEYSRGGNRVFVKREWEESKCMKIRTNNYLFKLIVLLLLKFVFIEGWEMSWNWKLELVIFVYRQQKMKPRQPSSHFYLQKHNIKSHLFSWISCRIENCIT
jgi:hypothetical protein